MRTSSESTLETLGGESRKVDMVGEVPSPINDERAFRFRSERETMEELSFELSASETKEDEEPRWYR